MLRLQQKIWDYVFIEMTLGWRYPPNFWVIYGTDAAQRLGLLFCFVLFGLTIDNSY
jgi:hypothetical protein